MNNDTLLKQRLSLQGLPVYESDIPYIHRMLSTINQAEAQLKTFPDLKKQSPITVMDKRLLMR